MRRALAALLLLAGLFVLPSPGRADPTPLHYLAIGDSITHGGYGVDPDGRAWRERFDTLVTTATGVAPIGDVFAAAGWGTADILPQVAAAVFAAEQHRHLDLVVIAVGTNDAAGPVTSATRDRYGGIVGAVLELTPASTRVALTLIEYSTPPASAGLIAGEHAMNDAIYGVAGARGWTGWTPGPRFAGWVNLNPASGAPALSADGIHPTAAGYTTYGDLAYAGVRATFGWPAS